MRRVYIVIIYYNPICNNILRGVCVNIWIEKNLLLIVPLGSGNKDMESFYFLLTFFSTVELFKHLLYKYKVSFSTYYFFQESLKLNHNFSSLQLHFHVQTNILILWIFKHHGICLKSVFVFKFSTKCLHAFKIVFSLHKYYILL